MTGKWNRRQVLQDMAIASTALVLRGKSGAQVRSGAAKPNLEIQIVPLSDHTFRLSIFSDDGNVVTTNGLWCRKTGVLLLHACEPTRLRKRLVWGR